MTFGYSKFGNDQQKRPKIIELADYGWTTAHHPLCEMITFPPEKQGSMARTVGPLTQIFKYLTTSGKYREKWLKACLITFAHVSNISGLLELIGGKPVSEIRPVLRELGNLALLVTARNSNRATPAPSLFALVLSDQRISYGMAVPHSKDHFGPFYAKHLDFSGKGAFMLYKLACSTPVRLSSVFTDEKAQQVIFHSWWGTALEDCSLLQQITDCNRWFKRSEFGTSFQRIGSKELGSSFELLLKTGISEFIRPPRKQHRTGRLQHQV